MVMLLVSMNSLFSNSLVARVGKSHLGVLEYVHLLKGTKEIDEWLDNLYDTYPNSSNFEMKLNNEQYIPFDPEMIYFYYKENNKKALVVTIRKLIKSMKIYKIRVFFDGYSREPVFYIEEFCEDLCAWFRMQLHVIFDDLLGWFDFTIGKNEQSEFHFIDFKIYHSK